jgi:hypothetical protein
VSTPKGRSDAALLTVFTKNLWLHSPTQGSSKTCILKKLKCIQQLKVLNPRVEEEDVIVKVVIGAGGVQNAAKTSHLTGVGLLCGMTMKDMLFAKIVLSV